MSEQISNETVVNEKPLVTFALFAYNQEKYIREAVEGALAQTYSPLQIILSDDCSSDRTFEIIQEMVAEYAGPHEILLNRNEPNLGLAGHINYVMSLAKGELIVVAAGDDISYANRTSNLFNFYIEKNKPNLVFSDCLEVNMDGTAWLGKSIDQKEQTINEFYLNPKVWGATCAFSKELIILFPKLSNAVTNEDLVFPVRAYILGTPPKFLDEKLVTYRRDAQRGKGSDVLSIKFFWQIWPYYLASKQNIIDANLIKNVDKQLYNIIFLHAEKNKILIDFIKCKKFFLHFMKIKEIINKFGNIQLIKLMFIKFGYLTDREKNLLISDI